ncbi:MAG: putative glycoside hydrolase [Thermomicrobiales bacterium]
MPPRADSPLPWLPWGVSLIFPIAVMAVAGTMLLSVLVADEPGELDESGEIAASTLATETPSDMPTREPVETRRPPTEASVNAAGNLPTVAATPTEEIGTIAGVVTDSAGNPLRGARVTDGSRVMVTGADGLFEMALETPEPDAALRVVASGFHDWTRPVSELESRLDVSLETQQVNALYMNPNMSGTDEDIDRFIDIINTTSANAIVIDIKEEIIYYDSQVELFVDAGTVRPIMDLSEVLQKFKDHGIYTIARLVVFKDGLVAQANPDMAVLNNVTGDLWRDDNGVAWVNPMVHELWDANAELAVEAAGYGFDEIQYDYVRFPTDGDFTTMDFGLENTQENREKSIEGFLAQAREALLPTGAKQSADVFGYTLLVDDDLGIGQNFPNVAEHVDYISPMIYPSHWPNGSLAVDGHPNDFPYETIEISMRKAGEKLDGDMLRVRPWLQDFNYFDLMPYGNAEVRAQIEAVEASGASGWMMWDPNNRYHPGGLDPDPQSATPVAGTPAAGTPASRPAPGTPILRRRWQGATR